MDADKIENAMRYGSQDPHEARAKNDLGRFGLGLKMASLSQCRKLTVMSKKDGKTVAASWDLDYIKLKKSWALKVYSEDEMENLPGFFYLNGLEHGTVVLWQDFDRLEDASANAQKSFDEKIELTRKHLSLVFHRFLGDENPQKRLALYFNGDPVQPMDPFLTRHPSCLLYTSHHGQVDCRLLPALARTKCPNHTSKSQCRNTIGLVRSWQD